MFIQSSPGFSTLSLSANVTAAWDGFSPEQRLVVLCSQRRPSRATIELVRSLLSYPIDWFGIARLALGHGVLPLLFWTLKNYLRDAVPDNIYHQLKSAFYLNTIHNIALARELEAVVRLLTEHGIPASSYKGPSLSIVAYGSLSFRQFGDLDVLVREQDAKHAKDLLLEERGYADKFALSASQDRVFQHTNHTFNLFRNSDGVIVELHWRLFPGYFSVGYPVDELLENGEQVPILEGSLPGLRAEDLLLILCIHGTKHAWDRLSLAVDISELLRSKGDWDWPCVLARAREIGANRMLLSAVALANALWATPVPARIAQALLSDSKVAEIVLRTRARLFASRSEVESPFSRLPFHLSCRERFRDRARCLVSFLFTPALDDLEIVGLPTFLSFLYLPLRILRLFMVEPILALLPRKIKTAAKRVLRRNHSQSVDDDI